MKQETDTSLKGSTREQWKMEKENSHFLMVIIFKAIFLMTSLMVLVNIFTPIKTWGIEGSGRVASRREKEALSIGMEQL